jgi:peptidyl-dipeptidase A
MRNSLFFLCLITLLGLMACNPSAEEGGNKNRADVDPQQFIDDYTKKYQELYYASAKAEWKSNTEIIEGDSTNDLATRAANEAFAEFTGSVENIETISALLKREDLTPLQRRQLEVMLYSAANQPQTVKEKVKARIAAETAQTTTLFGFDFQLDGKSVSTNQIDSILKASSDLDTRLKAWEASKAVGKDLKSGLVNLRNLRNETVQALDYADYFTYQVSDYGMDNAEMMTLMQQLVRDIWPMYRELHTYARYELAEKYDAEVPEYLPAHWLPNRWGQDWAAMTDVEGINIDVVLEEKGSEWLVKTAEEFYVSVGFPELPQVFWDKSSLYPLPEDAGYKKNNHASAWHLDLENDVRSLMSVVPNTEWYETTHHELGHIYYYLTYTNPDVPPILRGGANRGYHEAMGSLLGLASLQQPYMEHLELIPKNIRVDQIRILLKEALNYIVFMPFSAGVMTEFEHDLYASNLAEDQFNQRWWELKKKYQGIVPPSDRGEEFCDAASKTHINNDAAQYYDYAMSYVLLFQFHDHIAKKILKQDPHATNYADNKEVGDFLKSIMQPGASRDWRELLQESVGEGLSARAMLEYFQPLMEFLQMENKGRTHTLPENI